MPMLNLSWNDASTVCVPSECVLIDMRDERMSQFRPHRGSSGKHLVRCTDMCHCPAGVLSVWSDGAVHLKPRERLNFGKEMRSTKSGREAQTLGENLTNLMKMSVQPCATSYYPIECIILWSRLEALCEMGLHMWPQKASTLITQRLSQLSQSPMQPGFMERSCSSIFRL